MGGLITNNEDLFFSSLILSVQNRTAKQIGEHGAKSHKGKLSQAYIQHNQWRELFAYFIHPGTPLSIKLGGYLAILFSAAELGEKASLNFTLL